MMRAMLTVLCVVNLFFCILNVGLMIGHISDGTVIQGLICGVFALLNGYAFHVTGRALDEQHEE